MIDLHSLIRQLHDKLWLAVYYKETVGDEEASKQYIKVADAIYQDIIENFK
jgi:hypothetical protein